MEWALLCLPARLFAVLQAAVASVTKQQQQQQQQQQHPRLQFNAAITSFGRPRYDLNEKR